MLRGCATDTRPICVQTRSRFPHRARRSIDFLSGGDGTHGGPAPGAPRDLRITIPRWCGSWAVGMDEFKEGVVGAKSRNLANLRGRLPDWVKLPPAVTVPFGSFEQARSPACATVLRTWPPVLAANALHIAHDTPCGIGARGPRQRWPEARPGGHDQGAQGPAQGRTHARLNQRQWLER